jgi:hypothetical protein
MSEEYRIHSNKLYKAKDSEYVTKWVPCDVKQGGIEPEWRKPKIPYYVWQEMKAFCLWTQKEFQSEGMVLLFFDDEKGWVPWAPPQETWGMSVDTLPDDPAYTEQRKHLPELMLGSLHHHCTTSAFASGTDDADELNKDGIHFTLGHMDKGVLDIDTRFLQGKSKTQVSARNWIEFPEWVEHIPYEDIRNALKDRMLAAADAEAFPEFWKDNITKGFKPAHTTYWSGQAKKKQETKPSTRTGTRTPTTTAIATTVISPEVQEFLELTGVGLYDLGFILCDNCPDDMSEEGITTHEYLTQLMLCAGVTKHDLTDAVEQGTGVPITEFMMDYTV